MTKEVPYAAFYQNLHTGYALCGHAGFLRGAGRSGGGDRHRQLVRRAPHRLGRTAWLRNGPAALDGPASPPGYRPVRPELFRQPPCLPEGLGGDGENLPSGGAAGRGEDRDDERPARRLSRRQDPRLDHHQLAAGDPGHSGLPVERGGHPQVEGTGPHGGGLRHPSDRAGKPRDAAGVQPGDPVLSAGGRGPFGGHESGPLPPVLDGRRPHRGRPGFSCVSPRAICARSSGRSLLREPSSPSASGRREFRPTRVCSRGPPCRR